MDGVLALAVVCSIFAIGDFVSIKTRAICSMMFASSAILLVGFWVGLPTSIFNDAALLGIGNILVAFLITHMGTLMDFHQLKKQWRTVVISVGAVVAIGAFISLVGAPILGREYAIAAAPPISGGVVAAIIMGEVAEAKGLETLVVFTALLVVVQGFFGYPVASIMLGKESKKIQRLFRENKLTGQVETKPEEKVTDETTETTETEKKPKHKFVPELPEKYQTPFIYLAKLGLVALLSFQVATLLNDVVHRLVIALIMGIIGRETGFLEENIMVKANAFGLAMVALMSVIFANLTSATPEMVLSLAMPLVISLSLGLIGIVLASVILSKVVGYSREMSIAIGVSALFGFPGTFIISKEVATAVGETEEEKQAILNEILPKMLVAGFATVTIASVVLAGFMAKML
ncbi:hypothetical protein [Tindallia californiensis]|uniref:Na+/glutamate symporter n=1 Tax=Tindallia californiensis TaxID=159292 RepID=A0A1H3PCU7_9FIRM|nr:hypothetical protein [Tindallia californiensis]SDY98199.1 Na+/glutamate symporter [Tindallia californiensis]